MKAISNENLKDKLHYGPDCMDFVPVLNYSVTNNTTTKTATITDASVGVEPNTIKKILVNVFDKDGKSSSGVITAAAGNVVVSLVGLRTNGISIKATVILNSGCKFDLGVYDLDGKTGSGVIENNSNQGKRF